jgi:hypothetical protein
MTISKYFKISVLLVLVGVTGCTKLDESYKSTVPGDQAATALGPAGVGLLLQSAYNDLPGIFVGQDQLFSLEENSTDESLVPTRGGDWDDNGVWRVIHNHTWNADHGQVLSVYNGLNKLNFDATNVLAFKPSKEQAAEARFLRALSLYYILDLYNQFPFRNPGDTLLNAPKVYSGDAAIQFIISELEAIVPDLGTGNGATKANPSAAQLLLMKCYLNRGAFNNRAAPTFDDADMQKVITLGTTIMGAGFSYQGKYFTNFNNTNGGSKELVFAYPATENSSTNNPGMQARWMMTFHYNEYTAQAPNAGWNGFSTTSDFYKSFAAAGVMNYTPTDTAIDTRLGGRKLSDSITTAMSGIRPGFLVGQVYDAAGNALKDRKGAPLAFEPVIAPTMIETGTNLEVTGIRVAKYVPDFSTAYAGANYSSNVGNWLVIMRYPNAVLMLAEALMRQATPNNAQALTLVNGLRAARGAAPLASMILNDPTNVDVYGTLLGERGRELYFESERRTDLIRFGVYLTTWQYKPTDDPKYLVYPVPNQSLAVNPNLKQNPGY